ncbi:copper fist DNA-binding domain-containing protein [Sporobolomyces salmoneus]|uniref:copper fist DNA-binding domain-containing protein n=1 Tax=Sporobolomyces salmoneus TaxID=183962 RepID=UPI00316F0BF8
MLIEGIKFSCASCIKGHRQASCAHGDRELFEVKKRGRPVTACETCRQSRKESNSHKTCTHCVKVDALEPDLVRSLPNGASDPASMALVRRASSVRSRSSASSAPNHPPLPDLKLEEEDLATVGRKKSVSKSRRKDSKTAKDPHDLSHGHSAHHSTHQSSQFSPYPAIHSHSPAHPPLPVPSHSKPLNNNDNSHSPVSPQPISTADLASAFFFRDFDKLEATSSSASSSGPPRPDSAISNSAASLESSEGAESPEFKEPLRRPSNSKDHPPPPVVTVRPVKERKRSGLAQMYGAEEEEEQEHREKEEEKPRPRVRDARLEIKKETTITTDNHYFPTTFSDYASTPWENFSENSSNNYNRPPPPESSTFSLPSCDYAVPRQYVLPMAEYSSTAPSAYSAYSGYTPPLERTTSYSVEGEEEDPLGALSELQPQQTDLDILEWISTIAPLPPSSTPVSNVNGDASSHAPTSVPSFDWTVPTSTTSYPEPPPSSVGVASSDFAGLVLSPSGEFESSSKSASFPLPLPPSDASSSIPAASSSSSTSHSFSQSQSQSQSQDDQSFYFPDFNQSREAVPNPQNSNSNPPPPSFDSGDIHLERYGIDESYFARLGSFEPTATPTSTPVHEALAGWEKRIEQTKGLMMQEFGERLNEQQRQGGGGGESDQVSWGEWSGPGQGGNQQMSSGEEEEFLNREIRDFVTGKSREAVVDSSDDSGSRERVRQQVDERNSGAEGDNEWWLKLNAV